MWYTDFKSILKDGRKTEGNLLTGLSAQEAQYPVFSAGTGEISRICRIPLLSSYFRTRKKEAYVQTGC